MVALTFPSRDYSFKLIRFIQIYLYSYRENTSFSPSSFLQQFFFSIVNYFSFFFTRVSYTFSRMFAIRILRSLLIGSVSLGFLYDDYHRQRTIKTRVNRFKNEYIKSSIFLFIIIFHQGNRSLKKTRLKNPIRFRFFKLKKIRKPR